MTLTPDSTIIITIKNLNKSQEETLATKFCQFKQFGKSYRKCLEQIFTNYQIYMCSSTYKTVKVFLTYIEVYIQTVNCSSINIVP